MASWLIDHWQSIAAIAGAISAGVGAVWKLAPGVLPAVRDFLGNWISTGVQNFYLKRQIRIMESYISQIEKILAANGINLSDNDSKNGPE